MEMKIGPKPFVVAELSGNHKGSLETAKEMILRARHCGCDAVKIQTYEPEDLLDPQNNHLYNECRIPRDWYPALYVQADTWGIPLFSSVFAPWAIDFLRAFRCPAFKLASPESTRLPYKSYWNLRDEIKSYDLPLWLSSGQSDWTDMQRLSADVMLYCIAGYPATFADSDLSFFRGVNSAYYKYGFSDHTSDIKASVAMIGAGARIIEKHFKLDNNCVDAAFSLDPTQMKLLCDIAHR